MKLKPEACARYNLSGTAYLVNASTYIDENITASRAKTFLDCLQLGKITETDPEKVMKSMAHDVLGLHLVLVSEDRSEEAPINCGCKSFQKVGQCSHATFVAHVEKMLNTDLARDFKNLPENKKRGRKPKASKKFGPCLQKD